MLRPMLYLAEGWLNSCVNQRLWQSLTGPLFCNQWWLSLVTHMSPNIRGLGVPQQSSEGLVQSLPPTDVRTTVNYPQVGYLGLTGPCHDLRGLSMGLGDSGVELAGLDARELTHLLNETQDKGSNWECI